MIYLSSTSTCTSDIELKLNLDLGNLITVASLQLTCSQHEEDRIHDVRHPPTTGKKKCDQTDIILNGQSIKHMDTFKCQGVVLDDILFFNDYVGMKVSKIPGMFLE